jgi:hypothetical protein
MTRAELHLLLLAPELVVIDVTLAALDSLLRALHAQHPTLAAPIEAREPPVLRDARRILVPLRGLRRSLRVYRRAVECLARDLQRDDLPF